MSKPGNRKAKQIVIDKISFVIIFVVNIIFD